MALTLALLITAPTVALVLGTSLSDVLAALQDVEVLVATGMSVACAVGAVLIGTVLGVPAGYLLSLPNLPGRKLWQGLVDLPTVIPHPIVGIGLLLVFGRHKLVGSALRDGLGLKVVSATPGIVLCMLVVSAPFIIKAARDGFRAVPSAYIKTARSLGASESRVFFTIGLPLALNHIRSGALLAWARAVSEFGSIVILAYYPRTAPVLIWDRFSAYGLRSAIAPSLILLLTCFVIFFSLQALGAARYEETSER